MLSRQQNNFGIRSRQFSLNEKKTTNSHSSQITNFCNFFFCTRAQKCLRASLTQLGIVVVYLQTIISCCFCHKNMISLLLLPFACRRPTKYELTQMAMGPGSMHRRGKKKCKPILYICYLLLHFSLFSQGKAISFPEKNNT